MTCPFSSKNDLLLVIVDDKACYSIHPSIVPGNHDQRSMSKTKTVIRIISVVACDDF